MICSVISILINEQYKYKNILSALFKHMHNFYLERLFIFSFVSHIYI